MVIYHAGKRQNWTRLPQSPMCGPQRLVTCPRVNTRCLTVSRLLLFSRYVMSDSLWAHEWQRARLLCPPPSPRVCSNSRPLRRWCYLTISSSAAFSLCLQSFPASGSGTLMIREWDAGVNSGHSTGLFPGRPGRWRPRLACLAWPSQQPHHREGTRKGARVLLFQGWQVH